MNTILTMQANQYEIKLENFEGPLDLLYHLIEKSKMDIYDVKLADLADSYIKYLNEAEKLNMEIASEFLVIASTLLYLKSKRLLPKIEEETEEEITEEELRQKLLEYKQYKEMAETLKLRQTEYKNRFFKKPDKVKLSKIELEKEYEKEIIPKFYSKIVNINKNRKNVKIEDIEQIAIRETVSVSSKVKDIFKELFKTPKFIFTSLVKKKKYNKTETVTAFIGLLELTRKNKVITKQKKLFGDIIVEKTKK